MAKVRAAAAPAVLETRDMRASSAAPRGNEAPAEGRSHIRRHCARAPRLDGTTVPYPPPAARRLDDACPPSRPARPIGLDAPTFAGLNPAQRPGGRVRRRPAATLAHGPLLVIAGAGSGKTLTLAARVARLVLAGADPARILLLTFSRRAAPRWSAASAGCCTRRSAWRRRGRTPRLAWCGTFHSDRRAAAARATPRRSASTRRSPSTTAATPRT